MRNLDQFEEWVESTVGWDVTFQAKGVTWANSIETDSETPSSFLITGVIPGEKDRNELKTGPDLTLF